MLVAIVAAAHMPTRRNDDVACIGETDAAAKKAFHKELRTRAFRFLQCATTGCWQADGEVMDIQMVPGNDDGECPPLEEFEDGDEVRVYVSDYADKRVCWSPEGLPGSRRVFKRFIRLNYCDATDWVATW